MVVIDNLLINNINGSYIQNTVYESKLSPTEKDKYIELQKKQIEKNIISVPKKITSVPDIPKTRSGKISELSVKAAINGNVIKNIEALDNPHSLDFYKKIRKQN